MRLNFGVGFEIHHGPSALAANYLFEGQVGDTLGQSAVLQCHQHRAFAQAAGGRGVSPFHDRGAERLHNGLDRGGHLSSVGAQDPPLQRDRALDFGNGGIEAHL